MTTEQQMVKDWMKAFGQKTPETPVIPSLEIRKLRAKLTMEEAIEKIHALGLCVKFQNFETGKELYHFNPAYDEPVFNEETEAGPNLTEIADGCADLKVVTEGTLVACGLVMPDNRNIEYYEALGCENTTRQDPFFNEVMRSNWTKLWSQEDLSNSDYMKDTVYQKNDRIYNTKFLATKVGDKWLIKDSTGKIIKSPSYSLANLAPIIEAMK